MGQETFDSWAILELMGHVRMAGRVTEEERFGCKMGRIDVPGENGTFTTVYFGGQSIYRMTPTTEEIARQVAAGSQPAPVHRWVLPAPKQETGHPGVSADDVEVDEEDFDDNDYEPRGEAES